MKRSLALCLAALTVPGCASMPFSPLISPRVTGRVLAADTRQPLAGVVVKSGAQASGYRSAMPPKGGELLIADSPVRTDNEGGFTLDTERVLTPFRGTDWFSVRLLFDRTGYEPFRTNYSRLNLSTNAPRVVPSLNVGDILLHPAAE